VSRVSLLLLIFLTSYSYANNTAKECLKSILEFYPENQSGNITKLINNFNDEQLVQLRNIFTQSGGDPRKEIIELGNLYEDYLLSTLPKNQQDWIKMQLKKRELTKVESLSEVTKGEMDKLKEDPLGTLRDGLIERDKLIETANNISVSREFNQHPILHKLDLIQEMNRVLFNDSRPLWDKIPVVSISNPLPMNTLAHFEGVKLLSARQWDYLTLIPEDKFVKVFEELEGHRKMFLDVMKKEDGKKEINKLFDEMKDTLETYQKSTDKDDFLKLQRKKFNWKNELLAEYIFKTIWFGGIGTVLYLESQHKNGK